MKYFYLNLVLVAILIFIFSNVDYSNAYLLTPKPTPTTVPTSTPTPTPTPTQAPPVRLIIPKLNVDTTIEPVGVNEVGAMEAPKDWHAAGYYLGGPKPGETGTALIDGHYDDQYGAPAIFYNLRLLEAGDDIIIYDALARETSFAVTQKVSVSKDSTIDDLIVKDGNKNLALITCTGWWDVGAQSYSERLVVYAVKAE